MRVRLLVLLASLVLSACRGRSEAILTVSSWTLSLEDQPNRGRPVELPAHFDLPARPLRYWLTTRVELPPALRGRTLTLAIPYFTGMTALRVEGVEVPPIDESGWERYRSAGPHRWQLPPDKTAAASLELQLVVEHRWTQSAWFETAPRLSATPAGDARFRLVTGFNLVSCVVSTAAVFLVGFNYLLVFLVDRRRKLHGWMALQALSVVYYPLFQLGLTQPVFGTWDGVPMMLALPTAIVASVHFLHLHLRIPPPSRLWAAGVAGAALLAPIIGDPFHATRLGGLYVVVLVAVVFVYQLAVPFRRWRTIARHRNTVVLLAGWIALILASLPDIAVWVGLGSPAGGLFTVYCGLLVFLIVQAGVLSSDHAHSLGNTEKLNSALRSRLDELKNRHQELLAVTDALRGQRRERDGDARRRRLLDAVAAEVEGIEAPGADASRIRQLAAELRLLAQLAVPGAELTLAPRDIGELARSACLQAAGEGGPRVECRAAPSSMALVDSVHIGHVLTTLLGDASRHTPSDGRIVVAVAPTEEMVRIDVEDSGTHPPPDPSGEHELAMSIATAIVERHRGTLEVRRAALGGVGVRIALPRAARSA